MKAYRGVAVPRLEVYCNEAGGITIRLNDDEGRCAELMSVAFGDAEWLGEQLIAFSSLKSEGEKDAD